MRQIHTSCALVQIKKTEMPERNRIARSKIKGLEFFGGRTPAKTARLYPKKARSAGLESMC